MEEALNGYGRKATQQENAQVTHTPLGRGRCISSGWRCCSVCAKRKPASHLSPGRYGEKVRFEFVVKGGSESGYPRYEWARGVSGTEIHNRLVEVYGPGVMSKQMVRRWCRTFSDGRQQVEDIPRAGQTRTATTDANVEKVDDMIRVNRRITIDEVAESHMSELKTSSTTFFDTEKCQHDECPDN
ncbi:histone-lysine N-methyltransferase SETMAR [Trichonephila inaurata madagascariensis]|uniref:Histone-lysine N-methyltransferase SETMAR n=1 Tax=Trichonephila inaurata madagascariensis TaxID=2747483 RepID=A0A8X6I5X1_9ARAC|nr:histone-lysine N-methyltransferase SETMAR [Trichonephila inaurata madagascariensis]